MTHIYTFHLYIFDLYIHDHLGVLHVLYFAVVYICTSPTRYKCKFRPNSGQASPNSGNLPKQPPWITRT